MELYDGCSSVVCSLFFFSFSLAECFGHLSMLGHGKNSWYLVHTTPLNRHSITQLTNFMERLKAYYIYKKPKLSKWMSGFLAQAAPPGAPPDASFPVHTLFSGDTGLGRHPVIDSQPLVKTATHRSDSDNPPHIQGNSGNGRPGPGCAWSKCAFTNLRGAVIQGL